MLNALSRSHRSLLRTSKLAPSFYTRTMSSLPTPTDSGSATPVPTKSAGPSYTVMQNCGPFTSNLSSSYLSQERGKAPRERGQTCCEIRKSHCQHCCWRKESQGGEGKEGRGGTLCQYYSERREERYVYLHLSQNYISQYHTIDTTQPMAAGYNPIAVESAWYDWWLEQGFFKPALDVNDQPKEEGLFVIPSPPPNVTGSLHIGHALATAIQDSLIRW